MMKARLNETVIELNRETKEVSIPSNSCNEEAILELDLSDYPYLKYVHIGDEAFKNVKSVSIQQNMQLKEIIIGEDCFTQSKQGEFYNSTHVINILDCSNLNKVTVGKYSFSDYGVAVFDSILIIAILTISSFSSLIDCWRPS